MSARRLLGDVAAGVRARPGRFALPAAGMTVGVLVLGLTLAVLGGLRERARRIVDELGATAFALAVAAPGSAPTATARPLTVSDVDYLSSNLSGAAVTGVRMWPATGDGPAVCATDPDWIRVRPARVIEGRFLDREDLRHAGAVAVAGSALCTERGWRVGALLRAGRRPYTLVGILDAMPEGGRVVLVPRTAAPEIDAPASGGAARLDTLYVRAPTAARRAATFTAARRLMQAPDRRRAGLTWTTPDQLVERLTRLQAVIGWAAGSLALLCLLSGGATMMALMLANVRDRVSEIGLRRALGATPRDIAALFVAEGLLLAAATGAIGLALAQGLIAFARTHSALPPGAGWETFILPPLVALLTGILFSWLPARRAARLDPSDALRSGT